jgi:NAD(P)-dependent dehydrogenase (short-subunit alcohol dehydrogenase family)
MTTNSRVAIVTGAAQGIGRRTAEVLAGQGYALALLDLQSTSRTRESAADALELLGDVSSEADVERMARQVEDRFGRADVLVNNGPFLLSRAFGRIMLRQGVSALVNVASIAGRPTRHG